MTRRSCLGHGTLGLILALLVASAPLARCARGPGGMRGDPDRAQLEQRVRARFAEMIRERLQLTDDQARRLGEAMSSFQEQRQHLFRDEQALRLRLAAVLRESDPSEDEARALLDRMSDLRQREAMLFQEEQSALLEILPPVKLVRFHAMREELSQRVQQLRGGQGPPPGRGPVGMGGPGDGPTEGRFPW